MKEKTTEENIVRNKSLANESGILTRFDVAELLGFKADTVRKWSYAGKIPSHKIGNKIIFMKHEILDWIKTK